MIDKVTLKIRKYPFQTGLIIGCLLCLLLVGFINLFQDNGKTLTDNADIIREDYLRMTIQEYGYGYNDQLAGWRYNHLGRAGDKTLKLMAKDETIDPQLLVDFADAVGKRDALAEKGASSGKAAATPAAPRKGISAFGKTLLVILGLLVVSAAGLYAATLIKTRKKQQRRADFGRNFADDPMDVITPEKARMTDTNAPDTLFDLDKLFPSKDGDADKAGSDEEFSGLTDLKEPPEMPVDEDLDFGIDADKITVKENEDLLSEIFVPEPDSDDDMDLDKLLSQFDEETGAARSGEAAGEKSTPADEPPAEEAEGKSPEDNVPQEENAEQTVPDDDVPEEDETEDEPPAAEAETEGTDSQSGLDIETSVVDLKDRFDDETETDQTDPGPAAETGDDNAAADEIENQAEKPLVEIDSETEADDEDELLKMIRGSRTAYTVSDVQKTPDFPISSSPAAEEAEESEDTAVPEESEPDAGEEPEPEDNGNQAGSEDIEEEDGNGDEADNTSSDVLIHYQSSYRVGNDMYDEVFSIDQGDVFRGECGIGIGETLNNTEPKAVTAFELWLFDKDDIHTSTTYLVSDFGLNNEGILERLQQHGKCERIKNNGVYLLETETLQVEVRVLELEYGTEMEEKSSYFTNVTFDVIARSRKNTED